MLETLSPARPAASRDYFRQGSGEVDDDGPRHVDETDGSDEEFEIVIERAMILRVLAPTADDAFDRVQGLISRYKEANLPSGVEIIGHELAVEVAECGEA